mmetsp:Transcript_3414/g.5793  ORF Transcript_3414/g.5793 Transcript_3414/m.5793 type:complete len:233 (+) Transcript_3414:263-961(+)
MSLLQTCSFVPEMIIDAPKELKRANAAKKIKDCVGVAFLRLYRAGCIVTLRGGSGVVMKKNESGGFSAPCAVQMLGPAFGASFGAQRSDYIIFFNTDKALNGFVNNVGTVGINGSLAAGTVGREGEALFTTASTEGFLVFCNSKGLYGGVSVEISGVVVDNTANQAHYGRKISPQEIFSSESQPKGEVFDRMYGMLSGLVAAKLEADPDATPGVTKIESDPVSSNNETPALN